MCFSAWGAGTIKIGVIGPMNFMQGQGHWNGALMAANEINAKGGVQVGREKMKIELVKTDSNELLNVTDATNAMERLTTQDKVDFVVGGFRSEAVLAIQDIAMDYKEIFIVCGAAHPELCLRVAKNYDRYKYFFRGAPFNSSFLVRTCFLQMAYVGDLLKSTLKLPKVKVALAAKEAIPEMGMEVVGVWRSSATATDVTSELSAIQKSGANMLFTVFSASVGITFSRQAGELKIPAVQVGINLEAQKDGFWAVTKGMGNYVLTKPFMDTYEKRFKEPPTYTAYTYAALVYSLVPSIEAVGSLDANKIVANLENREYMVPSGKVKYFKDAQGHQTHDLTWGPGYLTGLGVQWQDGKLVGVWPPPEWKMDANSPEITYKGIQPYKIPPRMHKQATEAVPIEIDIPDITVSKFFNGVVEKWGNKTAVVLEGEADI
ncbi:MAG: ABC transporter substrate-binding protein [Thermodesulfobacteriota bacterium]